LPIKATLNYAI